MVGSIEDERAAAQKLIKQYAAFVSDAHGRRAALEARLAVLPRSLGDVVREEAGRRSNPGLYWFLHGTTVLRVLEPAARVLKRWEMFELSPGRVRDEIRELARAPQAQLDQIMGPHDARAVETILVIAACVRAGDSDRLNARLDDHVRENGTPWTRDCEEEFRRWQWLDRQRAYDADEAGRRSKQQARVEELPGLLRDVVAWQTVANPLFAAHLLPEILPTLEKAARIFRATLERDLAQACATAEFERLRRTGAAAELEQMAGADPGESGQLPSNVHMALTWAEMAYQGDRHGLSDAVTQCVDTAFSEPPLSTRWELTRMASRAASDVLYR